MPAIRVVFLLTGAILGVFYPFVSVILAGRGFSPAEVGFTAALSSVALTLATPGWGHLGDVVVGRVAALRLAVIGSTIVVLGLLLDIPPIAVALVIVAFTTFQSALTPLTDAIAVNALVGAPRTYARVRLLASLGYAGASLLAGRLYDVTGFGPAPVLWAALGLGILVTTRWVPDVRRYDRPRSVDRPDTAPRPQPLRHGGTIGLVLRTRPRLRGVLLGLGLVHFGILAGFTFLSLRLLELGSQPSGVALAAGIKALAEIPVFLVLPRIIASIGIRLLLVAGMLLYALVMVAWAFIDNPSLLIASQVLNGVAYAVTITAAVLSIAALLPAELQGTGQGLYQTVAFGIAAICANAIGGLIYASSGAIALFLVCAVLALLGAVVTWRTMPARDRIGPMRSPR